ncbi:SOS response-associated peptidase family protein [Candidatus Deferrimicrobium sp.]|uniref:SOS response-associated peptidase family protein n=1 Tax=Candidatus Deferrimicrobium sp. TaxID=3060586 RepID=UPI00351D2F44
MLWIPPFLRGRELALLRWGLIPSWSKDPTIGNQLINARAETAVLRPDGGTRPSTATEGRGLGVGVAPRGGIVESLPTGPPEGRPGTLRRTTWQPPSPQKSRQSFPWCAQSVTL